MWLSINDCQFPKVLVQCHKNTTLTMSIREDCIVARIISPTANPLNIVTGSFKCQFCPAPDAGIEEYFHEPVSASSGSIRS